MAIENSAWRKVTRSEENSAWRKVTRSEAIDALLDGREVREETNNEEPSFKNGFPLYMSTGIGCLGANCNYYADMAGKKISARIAFSDGDLQRFQDIINTYKGLNLELTVTVKPDFFGTRITFDEAVQRDLAGKPVSMVRYTPAGPEVSYLDESGGFKAEEYYFFIPPEKTDE